MPKCLSNAVASSGFWQPPGDCGYPTYLSMLKNRELLVFSVFLLAGLAYFAYWYRPESIVKIQQVVTKHFITPNQKIGLKRSAHAFSLPSFNRSTCDYSISELPMQFVEFYNIITSADGVAPALILDEDLINCIANLSQTCHSLFTKRSLVLGIFADSFEYLHSEMPLIGVSNWTIDFLTDCYVFIQNGFTVYVRKVDIFQHYWFANACENQSALAVLPFNVTVLRVNGVFLTAPAHLETFGEQLKYSKFVACREDLSQSLRKKYSDFYDKSPIITEEAFQGLIYMRDLLYAHGYTPFLFGGTALGWYRECGIIPYTTDIDLAVPANQFNKSLETVLLNDATLSLYWVLGKPSDSLELSVYVNGIKIDVFFLYEEPTYSWVGGMMVGKKQKLWWKYPKLMGNLCTGVLRGHLFYVPCDIEDFLEADYGDMWYKPRHDNSFKWQSSHYNVHDGATWSMSEWSSVYRVFNAY